MRDDEAGNAETGIRAACEAGDFDGAATAALRLYGPQVLGYLVGVHRDETAAEEAFSLFAENLWKAMPNFQWRSSLRTWSYVLAHRASSDERRAEARHRRHVASPDDSPISQIAAAIRTETSPHLRTAARNAIMRLRDELPEEDRTLLILRVDRNLAWSDIAQVFGAEGVDDIAREAARLRKRFQLVKDRLRARAHKEGLT